MLSRVSRTCCN